MEWGGRNTLGGIYNTQIVEVPVHFYTRAKTFTKIVTKVYFWLMNDWSRKNMKLAGKLNAQGLLGWEMEELKL